MLRPYARSALDAEQLRRPPQGERLEPLPRPNQRTLRPRVHQPVPEPELAGEGLNVAVGREVAVGAALREAAVLPLCHHDAPRAPLTPQPHPLAPPPGPLPPGR